MAKIATFTDAFSGSSLNASNWYVEPDASNGDPSGTIAVSGGILSVSGGTYSDEGYYTSVNSQAAYDLTSSAVFVKITPGGSGTGDGDSGIGMYASNFSDGYNYDITGGHLQVQSTVGDSPTVVHSVTYSPTSHAWLKISEASGTITFAASPDGSTWSTIYTTTTETEGSWHAASSYVQLFYGSNSGASKPSGAAQFSSFNIASGGGGGGGGGGTFSATTVPILGMYNQGGSFPTPGPSAWNSGPTTNVANQYFSMDSSSTWGDYGAPFITQCQDNSLIPFVELEPWNYDQSAILFSAITGGSYDTYLTAIGTSIAASGQPCIITFAHEMNVSGQYPWSWNDTGCGPGGGNLTASEWIAGWTYVRNKVNSTAGGLALWMWACSADTGGSSTTSPVSWWPSSALPDMVGIDGYEALEGSPTTFSGEFGATLTDIRSTIGWSGPIFISETNLALMVEDGGDSIATFVADMAANNMSGILEFEEVGLPQMTSAQWTQYLNAVAADITPSGGGSGGSSGTGTGNLVQWASNDTTGTSLTLTLPAAVTPGNTVVLALAGYILGVLTGVTIGGTPVTFTKAATSTGYNAELWEFEGVTEASRTIVVTCSTPGIIGYAYELPGSCPVSVSAGIYGSGTSWASGSTAAAPAFPQVVIGLGARIDNPGSVNGPTSGGWVNQPMYHNLQSGTGANQGAVGAVGGYLLSSGSATYDYTGSLPATGTWAAVTAAFQVGGGGAPAAPDLAVIGIA